MEENTHYACSGCGNVSGEPGNCTTEGCSMNGQPLNQCNCSEGAHLDKLNS